MGCLVFDSPLIGEKSQKQLLLLKKITVKDFSVCESLHVH